MENLCERILGGVVVALGEVVVNLLNGDAHILQHLPHVLTGVVEHHGAVVRIVLFDEDVSVEAAHVLDAEDTDRTERASGNGDDLTLGNVGTQLGVGSRLQTVDGCFAGLDVALEGTVSYLYRQSAGHDALEAHVAVANL